MKLSRLLVGSVGRVKGFQSFSLAHFGYGQIFPSVVKPRWNLSSVSKDRPDQ